MKGIVFASAAFALIAPLRAEDGYTLERTDAGTLVSASLDGLDFTLPLAGDDFERLSDGRELFLKADGRPVQIKVVPFTDFLPGDTAEGKAPRDLFRAWREHETRHVSKLLKTGLEVTASGIDFEDGDKGLFWKYEMPDGMNAEVVRQLYVTRLCGGEHLLVVNGVLLREDSEKELEDLLVGTAGGLRVEGAPPASASREEPAPLKPPAGAVAPIGEYHFFLNRFGHVKFRVMKKRPRVAFVQGDETVWRSSLDLIGKNTWQASNGVKFQLENLAERVVSDPNRGINSGTWKLTVHGSGPAYAKVMKLLPARSIGDGPANVCYGGPVD